VTFWWWVLVFGGIAIAALGIHVVLGLRLWRKAKVLLAELARLSAVAGTLESAMGSTATDDLPLWSPEPLAIGLHRAE